MFGQSQTDVLEKMDRPDQLIFQIGITYSRMEYKKGSELSFRALNMAGVERFELPTRGFGIRCSANWSYTPVDSSKMINLRFEKTSPKARS